MNTNLQMEMIVELPEGFTVHAVNLNDIEPALVLFNRWSRAVIGRDEITDVEAIRNEWVSPNFPTRRRYPSRLRTKRKMAGYVEVWTTVTPVHPDIGTRRP